MYQTFWYFVGYWHRPVHTAMQLSKQVSYLLCIGPGFDPHWQPSWLASRPSSTSSIFREEEVAALFWGCDISTECAWQWRHEGATSSAQHLMKYCCCCCLYRKAAQASCTTTTTTITNTLHLPGNIHREYLVWALCLHTRASRPFLHMALSFEPEASSLLYTLCNIP